MIGACERRSVEDGFAERVVWMLSELAEVSVSGLTNCDGELCEKSWGGVGEETTCVAVCSLEGFLGSSLSLFGLCTGASRGLRI